MKKAKNLASKALTLAHKIKTYLPTESWSNILKYAWNRIRLISRMKDKLCYFQFRKKSTGELRDALGTMNFEFIDYELKGGSWEKWYIVKFYENNMQQWRSLDVRTLTKIYW